MIRAYSSWKSKISISKYLYSSFNKWPFIQYKFRVSLVLWNHNNGEHCWLGNGPEDDHWHLPQRGLITEGHYWKGWLFKECCIKAYYMLSWLEGRNWIGKGANATGMTASLRILSSKLIQTLGRASQGVNWSWSQCIKSHHAQTTSGKGLPSQFWNRNLVRSIHPGLRRKSTGLLLIGPKSS